MELNPTILSLAAPILAFVAAVVVARYTKRSQDASNDTSKWEAMFKANEAQFARLTVDVAESGEKIDRLEEKVDNLEREVRAKDKQLFWALTYIRELIRHWNTHHPDDKYPDPPDQIEELI